MRLLPSPPRPGLPGRSLAGRHPPPGGGLTSFEAGDLRFRWVPDWLQVPGGGDLGNTHGCVAPLPGGDMLFNTDAEHAVVRVSPDGAWKAAFGAGSAAASTG